VSGAAKLSGLAVIFAAGVLFAGATAAGHGVGDTTTDETTAAAVDTTVPDATPATTESVLPERTVTQTETTTVERTTTRILPLPAATTTGETADESSTPAWVWVLLAILAVALVAVIALLARRGRGGGGGGGVPAADRQRRLGAAVTSWTAQGWAIESQTADSAVLRRGGDAMLVTVDEAGHVSTRQLPGT
jgi:hypothetical protein